MIIDLYLALMKLFVVRSGLFVLLIQIIQKLLPSFIHIFPPVFPLGLPHAIIFIEQIKTYKNADQPRRNNKIQPRRSNNIQLVPA